MHPDWPLALAPGATLTGTVTQVGTIQNRGKEICFEARQNCALWFKAVNDERVECVIVRNELYKSINGITDPRDTQLDPFYADYLKERGSSSEDAFGTYNPFTRVLLLRGSTPKVLRLSDVHWNTHFYSLVVGDDGAQITGTAFCTDGMEDRENGVGSLAVRLGT